MQKMPVRIIDFHVHLFPDKMFEAIWDFFTNSYHLEILYKLYYSECIQYLRERGVEKIVYSNYAHREGIAAGLNEWNLQVLNDNHDLYCFAAYHPGDPNALHYAEKMLNHPRVLGFKLQLLVQQFYPYDERLFPLYDLVSKRGKRILFHVTSGSVSNDFVGLSQFQKLLFRYPDIPANIAHMGAFEYRGFMELLDNYPGLYLDTSYAFFKDMQGGNGFNLGNAPLEKHKNRILYGSDFPLLIRPRESELETLLSYDLSPEFYERVFYGNGMDIISS